MSDLHANNFNILFIASNEGSKGTYDFYNDKGCKLVE